METPMQVTLELVEQQELDWLKTGPEKVFLYVKLPNERNPYTSQGAITTWLGTVLDPSATFGQLREFPCFGPFPSKRRAVSCRIFGVLYHGFYYQSSGSYCRLRKAKRQKG